MTPLWTDIIVAVGTVLGAVFTALGLGFIIVQLRAARRQLSITTFEHLYSRMQGIHEMFMAKPHLRPFFYAGKELKEGADDYEEICIAAEMLADFFQQVSLELDLMPPSTAQGWKAYMSDVVSRSPALRDHLSRNLSWYPTRLLKIAEMKPLESSSTLAQPAIPKTNDAEMRDMPADDAV